MTTDSPAGIIRVSNRSNRLEPVTTRSIHVDSRYMLWNMAEVDGAANLREEMGIVPGISARSPSPLKAPAVSPAGRGVN